MNIFKQNEVFATACRHTKPGLTHLPRTCLAGPIFVSLRANLNSSFYLLLLYKEASAMFVPMAGCFLKTPGVAVNDCYAGFCLAK